jgi:hypothetical protein
VSRAHARFHAAHLAFTALGAVTIAVWPALVARSASTLSLVSARVSATACVIFVLLAGWAFLETRTGDALGLAERVSSSTAICWPFVVAYCLRQAATRRSPGAAGLTRGSTIDRTSSAHDCRAGQG